LKINERINSGLVKRKSPEKEEVEEEVTVVQDENKQFNNVRVDSKEQQ